MCRSVALVCELNPESLSADTRLFDDLGADSVSLVEIIEVTEDALRSLGKPVAFDDNRLADLRTVGDLVAYIQAVAP